MLLMPSFASAQEKPVYLIEIKAEYYPNEVYHLGYIENPDHTINSFFYENNEKVKRYYSHQDLRDDVAIIKTTSGNTVYELVRVQAEPRKGGKTYDITMSYMRNGLFKNRRSVDFTLIYNPSRQVYEVYDEENEEFISRVFVETNYWGKKAVGIARINSYK